MTSESVAQSNNYILLPERKTNRKNTCEVQNTLQEFSILKDNYCKEVNDAFDLEFSIDFLLPTNIISFLIFGTVLRHDHLK